MREAALRDTLLTSNNSSLIDSPTCAARDQNSNQEEKCLGFLDKNNRQRWGGQMTILCHVWRVTCDVRLSSDLCQLPTGTITPREIQILPTESLLSESTLVFDCNTPIEYWPREGREGRGHKNNINYLKLVTATVQPIQSGQQAGLNPGLCLLLKSSIECWMVGPTDNRCVIPIEGYYTKLDGRLWLSAWIVACLNK